jgi:hypothetical protein
MSETGRIILGICLLIIVYIVTRKITGWRIQRTYLTIIEDLKSRGALDPFSAVELPYARKSLFRIGLRDFRQDALKYLVASDIVGMTHDGKYYLKNKRIGSQDK